MELEFAGGLFGTGLYWLEIVIRVNPWWVPPWLVMEATGCHIDHRP